MDGKGKIFSLKHVGAARACDLSPKAGLGLCKLGCYCVVPKQTYT